MQVASSRALLEENAWGIDSRFPLFFFPLKIFSRWKMNERTGLPWAFCPRTHRNACCTWPFFLSVNERWLGHGVGYRNMPSAKIASSGEKRHVCRCSTLIFLPTRWTHGHHAMVSPFVFVLFRDGVEFSTVALHCYDVWGGDMVGLAIPSWVFVPCVRVGLDRPCVRCFARIHGRVFPPTTTGGRRLTMHGLLSDGYRVSWTVDTEGRGCNRTQDGWWVGIPHSGSGTRIGWVGIFDSVRKEEECFDGSIPKGGIGRWREPSCTWWDVHHHTRAHLSLPLRIQAWCVARLTSSIAQDTNQKDTTPTQEQERTRRKKEETSVGSTTDLHRRRRTRRRCISAYRRVS